MFRLIVLFAALATINAQYLAPTLTGQNTNIYRSPFNLGQVSSHQKFEQTPFSSVSKSDVRVSNPGVYSHGLAAPVAYGGYHAAAYPAAYPAAYARPAVAAVGYPGYHAPVVAKAVAPVGGLLGVAYSPSVAVSHMTYSNGLGLSYAW